VWRWECICACSFLQGRDEDTDETMRMDGLEREMGEEGEEGRRRERKEKEEGEEVVNG
jgi:hypothetical protein